MHGIVMSLLIVLATSLQPACLQTAFHHIQEFDLCNNFNRYTHYEIG